MNMKKGLLFPLFLLVIAPMAITACKGKSGTDTSEDAEKIDENADYRVILNACTGNKEDNKTVTGKYEEILDLNELIPAREGYKFFGWSKKYDKHTAMGDKDYLIAKTNKFKVGGHNQVLYGVWRKTSISDEKAQEELNKWIASSQPNHLYYHYFRFGNEVSDYNDWDVWAWPYAPTSGEGTKLDWVGRTQSADHMSATGDATLDKYGGAYVDIDLNGSYVGGWDNINKKILDTPVSFKGATKIGLQIVNTSTRITGSGFWVNDGSNLYVNLDDYAVDVNGGKAYHIFVVQDTVQDPSPTPKGEADPFEGDIGKNVTYNNKKYDNVGWDKKANMVKTSKDFSELGVGYQIMVSSFADSDGDGLGDIYGITNKLDYLEKLGVKALWLTPIQLSESYHGYDITDYEKVDPKFGSTKSPAALENKGKVTSDTALADYKELIEKAHEKGMKVVMDLVLNHTSTSNPWFVRSANLDANYRGYYQWGNHEEQDPIKEANNWYAYGSHPYSYYAKFGSSMPELNFSYVPTRVAVEDMSIYWARDIGVDGFRLDAVKHIFMTNEVSSTAGDTVVRDLADEDYSSDLTKNLQFFRELKAIVTKCAKKDVFFVGENFDGHAYHVAPYYEAFDSLFDFYTYFNLTSGAATGKANTTEKYGTVKGFLTNTADPYSISKDNDPKSGVIDGAGDMKKADNSAWNFKAVYDTYNKYRGDISLPGIFTSNHDIARVINRVAGSGTLTGLNKQGNVSSDQWADFEKSANCVKIAELMFPGLTWIYYGDEIGMTGNFPEGKDANSPYADLWYRQPMKWVANGQKGDEAGTTDFYVTGSAMRVEQDKTNKSSVVVPALTQMNQDNSEFGIMKKFIALKTGNDEVGKALRTGSFTPEDWVSGTLSANVLMFSRKIGSTTVKVLVNFNDQTQSTHSVSGTVLASYNGATASSLPPRSAVVIK